MSECQHNWKLVKKGYPIRLHKNILVAKDYSSYHTEKPLFYTHKRQDILEC